MDEKVADIEAAFAGMGKGVKEATNRHLANFAMQILIGGEPNDVLEGVPSEGRHGVASRLQNVDQTDQNTITEEKINKYLDTLNLITKNTPGREGAVELATHPKLLEYAWRIVKGEKYTDVMSGQNERSIKIVKSIIEAILYYRNDIMNGISNS